MGENDEASTELALDGAGVRLRRAREAAGLSLADIAARTRIAERHLHAIETGKFTSLASRAYAVGFARNYAREVELDEDAIASAVRVEFDGQEPLTQRYQPSSFEPGDPARVPAARVAWIAAASALAVVVAGYVFWRSFYAPAMQLPDLTTEATASATVVSTAPAALPAPSAQGPVVFTATEAGVWVKFYDAAGTQLFQKELALGESYTLPAEANGPMIRTAKPQALAITIGGQPVARLAEKQMTIGDVPVSAAALLARGLAPAVAPSAAAAAMAPAPTPEATRPAPRRESPAAPRSAPSPRSTAAPAPAPDSTPVVQPLPGAASLPQSSTVSQ